MTRARPLALRNWANLFSIFIAMVICTGCQRDFKNTQGLTKHRNTCQLALQNTTKLLNKRNEVLKMAKWRYKAEEYLLERSGGSNMEVNLTVQQPEVIYFQFTLINIFLSSLLVSTCSRLYGH
jgi:putative cell wall-binding protein